MIQYYTHQFLGVVEMEVDAIDLDFFNRMDPNGYVRVIDRDGNLATAGAAQLTPIPQASTQPEVSGEEVEIVFAARIPISSVVENVVGELSADELIEFIKILDERVQDWYVTEKLYEHFADQHRIFMKEAEGL